MGALQALPALDVRVPQAPSALDAVAKAQNITGNQQLQQQRGIEIEQAQQQLKDQRALTQAMLNWDGKSYEDLANSALKNGASANAAIAIQQHGLQVKTAMSKLDTDQLANLQTRHDLALGQLSALDGLDDTKLAPGTMNSVMQLQNKGWLSPDEAQPFMQAAQQMQPSDLRQFLKLHEKQLIGEKQQLAQTVSASEAQRNEAQGEQAQATAEKTNAETQFYTSQGLAPGVTPEMASYASYIKGGGDPQQYKANQAQREATATLPSKVALAGAEANARQQAAQGDPAVAGKMLADGSLTIADLKTRGTTPQFIEKATQAAQQVNPAYKPSDEVVAEQVAKSQSANQFFGSANSLIQKGGTLDQLEKLGKNVPQHDFPVLNTIDDWQQAARGKGPLAAYAATVLGVADDYSKVMGGGTGSDASRNATLALFSKAASPEQRADAIAATRNAVLSQRESRIGNNQFLKRQYGAELGGQSGGGLSIKAPNGKTYSFKDQQSLDSFKKAAGIQ